MPEFLDLVDEEDKVIGREDRIIIHRDNLLHREISVFFITPAKRITFQKRKPKPPAYVVPILDGTAGGHVDSGENSFDAALRESFEETGRMVRPEELILIDKFRIEEEFEPLQLRNNVWRSVYAVQVEDIDSLKSEEGKGVGFLPLTLDEIKNPSAEILDKYWFIPALRGERMMANYQKMLKML